MQEDNEFDEIMLLKQEVYDDMDDEDLFGTADTVNEMVPTSKEIVNNDFVSMSTGSDDS